jgi:predicted nucleic acid-binding protein
VPGRELVFVDTNVLVYAHDRSESRKQPLAQAVLRELWRTGAGVLSTQVLQEFYVVATRRCEPPMSPLEARELVALYATWQLVAVDAPMIVAASELEEAHTLSFWDALVVEAARRAGAARLLTEDMQDGREIGGLRIEDPFR